MFDLWCERVFQFMLRFQSSIVAFKKLIFIHKIWYNPDVFLCEMSFWGNVYNAALFCRNGVMQEVSTEKTDRNLVQPGVYFYELSRCNNMKPASVSDQSMLY